MEYEPINATYQGNCNSSSCNKKLQFKLMDINLCKRYGEVLPIAPILKEK